MGSAVAVQLEHLDQDGKPFQPAKIRHYLLTCGHVVRQAAGDGVAGWGALLEEIYCWQPGKPYHRTRVRSRRSGDLYGPRKARVSPISPCQAVLGEIPGTRRLAPYDWVLLEVEDEGFQVMPALRNWGEANAAVPFEIIGYPGGAGFSSDPASGHHWDENSLVESLASSLFRQTRTPPRACSSLMDRMKLDRE
jgi:hypothetical protein